MTENSLLGDVALQALRTRITKVFPAQVRAAVEQLSDEELWWRPNAQSNSVGNLVLHLAGSLLHHLCRSVGGFEYHRDRPGEFAERGPVPRQQVLAAFDKAIEQAGRTFDALDAAKLVAPSSEPDRHAIVFEDVLGAAVHMSTHVGQILYVVKMLREGSLDEVWIHSHRTSGAWRT
jgi:Protein of unknown function (DUF1572)